LIQVNIDICQYTGTSVREPLHPTVADAILGAEDLTLSGAELRAAFETALEARSQMPPHTVASRRLEEPVPGGSVALRELPEDGALYMLEDGASLLLPLRHLFQLRRIPESAADACYFYDRVEEGGVRWVSYHYEAEAEVVHADDDILALIEELEARLGDRPARPDAGSRPMTSASRHRLEPDNGRAASSLCSVSSVRQIRV
jgi:hypothetical protein